MELTQLLSPKGFRNTRVLSAVILVALAARHVLRLVAGVEGAALQGLFVVIDVVLAAVLVWRHRWALWPTILLGLYQMGTHGLDLSRSFLGNAPLDVPSLAVCLFFPTLATILYLERADEKEQLEAAKYERKERREKASAPE